MVFELFGSFYFMIVNIFGEIVGYRLIVYEFGVLEVIWRNDFF